MPSSGPNSPGTAANDAAVGTLAWTSPGNCKTSNNTYTQCFGISGTQFSNYLKATNFGFSIPGGATIDGILVEIERYASHNSASLFAYDEVVKLVKNGTVVGTNLGVLVTKWATGEAVFSYGGSSELWGTSWADSDINNTNFGVVLQVEVNNWAKVNIYAYVDHIKITVYYTGGGGSSSAIATLIAGD